MKGADWYRRPELALGDVLLDRLRGGDRARSLLRAIVLAVDNDGGRLQNRSGAGSVESLAKDGTRSNYPAIIGPDNPRGSIKARLITDGMDRFRADNDAQIFWPLFPPDQLSLPISVGEHVHVMFEDHGMSHGLWISRVSGHDSAGVFLGIDSYTEPASGRSAIDAFETPTAGYERSETYATLGPRIDPTTKFDG